MPSGRAARLDASGHDHGRAEGLGTEQPREVAEALRSVDVARGGADRNALADTLYGSAQVLSRHASNADALQMIEEAQSTLLLNGETADAWRMSLGKIHVLGELGRLPDALDEAKRLVDAAAVIVEPWLAGAAQQNLGVVLGLLGRHAEAREAYRRSREIYTAAGMTDRLAELIHNEATELLDLGRPDEAWALFNEARQQFLSDEDPVRAVECQRDAAAALLHSGRYQASIDTQHEALAAYQALAMPGEVARTLLALGETRLLLGRTAQAADQLEEAVAALAVLELPRDQARALLALGASRSRLDQRSRATAALQAAADLAARCDVPALAALAQHEIAVSDDVVDSGEMLRAALRPLEGLDRPVEVCVIRSSLIDVELAAGDIEAARLQLRDARRSVADVSRPDIHRRLSHQAARIEMAGGDMVGAADGLARLADLVRDDSSALRDAVARLYFLDDKVLIFDDLIACQLAVGRPTDALVTLERRKAWVLAQQLRATSSPSVALRDAVLSDSPQRAVEEVLVAFHAGVESITAFVHDGETRTVDLGSLGPVQDVLARLDALWVRHRVGGSLTDRAAQTADALLQDLRRTLWDPLLLPPGRPVRVSPDGVLDQVPFTALGGSGEPLIAECLIAVTPSAVLRRLGVSRTPARCVVLAPVPHVLPATAAEADVVKGILQEAVVLRGPDASADALRAALGASSLVHIASHGAFVSSDPFAAAVQMADRWVSAGELATWNSNGAVVVFAACGLGRSGGLGGEQTGMVRALLSAGVTTVVTAHWDVPDTSTMQLMTRMYAAVARGRSIQSALRDAQISAWKHGDHVFEWASFDAIVR